MSSFPTSVLDAVEKSGGPWSGPLAAADRAALAELVEQLGEDDRTQLLGALLDPDRLSWGRAAVLALHLVLARGGTFEGFVSDEVLEFSDLQGNRFGVVVLPFALPQHPGGRLDDVQRMLSALDSVFVRRRYALWVRRQLPSNVDVEPVRRAVHLWLAALDRGDRTESHAVYEDDDLALDLTLVPNAPGRRPDAAERVVTVMPLPSLERLAAVDGRVVEAASRAEESSGNLPLVCVAAADRPWRISRGYLQQLVYGTADKVETTHDGGPRGYKAEFTATGRSMFSDPACRRVCEIVWVEGGGTPFDYSSFTLQNPWAQPLPALRVRPDTFVVRSEPGSRRATLEWEPGS
jgi:hypothetical protein